LRVVVIHDAAADVPPASVVYSPVVEITNRYVLRTEPLVVLAWRTCEQKVERRPVQLQNGVRPLKI
jgi:hypothetical protein